VIPGSRAIFPGFDHPQPFDGEETLPLARKPNYSFEKRRKEIDRKAKKDARREEKLRRKQEGAAGEAEPPAPAEPEESPPPSE
jgi:hypothetical protein